MTSSRNPLKDQVAFAGAATTGFTPRNTERSQASLAARGLHRRVMRECGLTAADVDGICRVAPVGAATSRTTLGIPEVTWFANPAIPFVNHVAAAVGAVHSGLCDVVLAYHAAYRLPVEHGVVAARTRSGAAWRRCRDRSRPAPETVVGAVGYTAWASRYMYEFGAHEGALRLRRHQRPLERRRNPAAAMRDPMTMDDYLRRAHDPLAAVPARHGRAGRRRRRVHHHHRRAGARPAAAGRCWSTRASLGMIDKNEEDQTPEPAHHGQQVVVDTLKAKGDFWIDGTDVYFPYDGFTPITLNWIENAGCCGPGEAGAFIESTGTRERNRILIDGRVP